MTDWGAGVGRRWAIEIVSFFGRSSKYQKTSWAGQVENICIQFQAKSEMALVAYSTSIVEASVVLALLVLPSLLGNPGGCWGAVPELILMLTFLCTLHPPPSNQAQAILLLFWCSAF